MRRFLVLALAFFGSSCVLFGQKVKYKDLYPLLESRQYDLAIPLLRKYLLDIKNSNNASAHLQMAMYMEKLSMQEDILKRTEIANSYSDSAANYYQRSRDLLTEKHLKKNTDYFRSYERRDVRSGKVGIKAADVQYQLEKNIERLNIRKGLVRELKDYYVKGTEAYDSAQSIFRKLRESYPTDKGLYLKSDQSTLNMLDLLGKQCENALVNLGEFRSMIGSIEKPGYDPKITLVPVENYESDGITGIDPALQDIKVWDYSEWGKAVKTKMKTQVWPVRDDLAEYDRDLNELRNKMTTDSISVMDQVKGYHDLEERLLPIDPDPLPFRIFNAKIAELEYLSGTLEHRNYQDSADVVYKLKVLRNKLNSLSAYDSVLSILENSSWKAESLYYESYISSVFEGPDGLEKFITSTSSAVGDERERTGEEFTLMEERSRWLIDASDSIPLFQPDTTVFSKKFVPVIVEADYTVGLYFSPTDSIARGYFSLVNGARTPEAKVFFNVESDYFNRNSLADIMNKVDVDESGQIYHLMFYVPLAEQENYAASLCKIYTSDGLAWEKDLILDTAPADMEISNGSGEVRIAYDINSYQGEKELPDGVILDKKGELKE